MWKSNCPPKPSKRLGCSWKVWQPSNINVQRVFSFAVKVDPLFFAQLLKFSHTGGFPASPACLRSPSDSSQDSWDVQRSTVCFRLLSCCRIQLNSSFTSWSDGCSPTGFSDREQNSGLHQLWQVVQVLKVQSSLGPSPACLTYDALIVECCVKSTTDVFQKVLLLTQQSTQCLHKVLEVVKIF